MVSSLDFDEHVRDAQSKSSSEVDQHKRVHSGQENAAERRDDSTQTAHKHSHGYASSALNNSAYIIQSEKHALPPAQVGHVLLKPAGARG